MHRRTMLSLLPSSSFSFVAGGLAGLQQSRSPVANVNMALDRPIRVAVIGGGPSGACAAEIFAKVSHGLMLRALGAIRTLPELPVHRCMRHAPLASAQNKGAAQQASGAHQLCQLSQQCSSCWPHDP